MEKKISILEVNILFLIMAILLLTLGTFVQSINVKSGLIITEYFLVLLPVIIFIKIKGLNMKETLRLNKIKPKYGIITIGITLLSYPIALFFNLLVMTLISILGKIEVPSIPTAYNFKEYIGLFFIVAISAGICEEVLFRGLLLKVYERKYDKIAIIISAVLFGIFHFNLQNLMGPIILGLIFGYLVYLTNSIYVGIIGHIVNNGFAVTLAYGINKLTEIANKTGYNSSQSEVAPTTYQLFATTIFIGAMALIAGLFIHYILKYIKRDIEKNNYNNYHRKIEKNYGVENIVNAYDKEVKLVHYIPIGCVFCMYIFIGYLQLM